MKTIVTVIVAFSLLALGCTKSQKITIPTETPPPPSCFDETGELTFDPALPLPRDCEFGWSVLNFSVILPQGWTLWADGLPALYQADTGNVETATRFAMIIFMSDTYSDATTWWEQCESFNRMTVGDDPSAAKIKLDDSGVCSFDFARTSMDRDLACSFIGRRLSEETKQFFFVMACGNNDEGLAAARSDGLRMVRSSKAVQLTNTTVLPPISSAPSKTSEYPMELWK